MDLNGFVAALNTEFDPNPPTVVSLRLFDEDGDELTVPGYARV